MSNRNHNYGSTQPSGEYEEFFGGTLPCPSCRGSGRIPRESENELVALIPVRDKRLKPSKTKYYVALAICVCLLLGGLLTFFLFPRTIQLKAARRNLTPTQLYINVTERLVKMGVPNVFNVSNQNFFGITVAKIRSQVFFDMKIMNTMENKTHVYIPPRGHRQYYMFYNVTFQGEEGGIAAYCASGLRFGHTLIMPFETTMYIQYMGRTEETTLTSYQHVRCSPDLVPTTTSPKPTTTATTTTSQPTTSKQALNSL